MTEEEYNALPDCEYQCEHGWLPGKFVRRAWASVNVAIKTKTYGIVITRYLASRVRIGGTVLSRISEFDFTNPFKPF